MNGREKSHMDTDSLPKAGAAKIIDARLFEIDSLPKAVAAKIIDAKLSREVLVKREYGSFLFESYMSIADSAAGLENKEKIAEEIALDLMAKHAEFYSEMKQEELVKRKSVLMCGKGSRLLQIDMCLDHGVESGNEPVMSCKDCKPENIQGFGTCISPIPVKSPEWTHYPFLNSDGKYQCMPVLGKRWIQNDSRIYLETRDEGTVEALKSGAYLTCIYGGVITVVEVEEKEEEIEELLINIKSANIREEPGGNSIKAITKDQILIKHSNENEVREQYEWIRVSYFENFEEKGNDENINNPDLWCWVQGWIVKEFTESVSQKTVDKSEIYKESKSMTPAQQLVNARYIYSKFKMEGWTDNAIFGIFGNMERESQFSPAFLEKINGKSDDEKGFGLTQWTPKTKYTAWKNEYANGVEDDDIDCQLERIFYEVKHETENLIWDKDRHSSRMSFQEFTKSEEEVGYLAEVFMKCYERPGVEALKERKSNAQKWKRIFGVLENLTS